MWCPLIFGLIILCQCTPAQSFGLQHLKIIIYCGHQVHAEAEGYCEKLHVTCWLETHVCQDELITVNLNEDNSLFLCVETHFILISS